MEQAAQLTHSLIPEQPNQAQTGLLNKTWQKCRALFLQGHRQGHYWNQRRKKKLTSLVFITEETFGRPVLDAPMPRAYIKYLAQNDLTVSIEYVRHES
jgi:hypothetical protein